MTPLVFRFAARVGSPMNGSQGAIYEDARRRRSHRGLAMWNTVAAMRRAGMGREKILPARITIIRIAPRRLDDDNNVSGCKSLRDGIADALQVDDGGPLVDWKYDQTSGDPKEYAVEVRIERMPGKQLIAERAR